MKHPIIITSGGSIQRRDKYSSIISKYLSTSGGIVHRKGRLLKPFLRVTFPQFELYSNPSIKLSDVRTRRFDLIDRKVQKARQEIMSQEDSMIFDILDKVGKNG